MTDAGHGRHPRLLHTIAAATTVLAGGCDGMLPSAMRCPAGQQPMLRGELILGRNIGNRPGVSDEAFRRFLDEEVTPRFTDGFTVIEANGQWRDAKASQIVREEAKVLLVVMPNDGDGRRRLQAVGEAYKARFSQQSVVTILTAACASF